MHSTNRCLRTYIDSCHKESEIHAVYPQHITVHFENVANITVDSGIVTPQKKKNGREEDFRKIIIFHMTKMSQIRVSMRVKQFARSKRLNQI